MRVTNALIYEGAQAQVAAARDRAFQAQQKVTDGVRVVHPGDDPAAASMMVTHQMSIDRLATIDKTVSTASDELQTADGALQSVSTLLARARDLTVQLGSDTYSASERASGAAEIRGISAQIVQVMNTQIGGRYIFGGNVDRTPPFDVNGNYQGDTATRQVEVAPGLLQNSSIRADQLIKGVGGGVDILANLGSIANALASNDGATARSALDTLAGGVDQIAAGLAQTGTMMDGMKNAQSVSAAASDAVKKALSAESEVDIFDASSQLAAAQQGLEATLTVTAKSFQYSLLDFLK
jgi:flagellar hook-associated protein 3 FlgL